MCSAKIPYLKKLKHKNIREQFSKSYMTVRLNFYKLMDLFNPLDLTNFVANINGCIVIFGGFWMKIVFHKNKLMYKYMYLEKNIVRLFFMHKVMFMVGYYNELIVLKYIYF